MIKVALVMDGEARVAGEFAAGVCLMIADADTGECLCALPVQEMTPVEVAGKIVEADCEAVITGPISRGPFEIIADEGCATRYNGVGLPMAEALEKMNAYALPLIPDYIGGTGCHPGNEANCKTHTHD